jgi:F0F1-type ATP synthase assembly protein I
MAEETPPRGDSRSRPAGTASHGSGAETGWAIIGTMISGMAVWGGAGWLLDQWLNARAFFPVGIILGMAVAIYVVVVRFGGADPSMGKQRSNPNPGGRRSQPRTQKGRR